MSRVVTQADMDKAFKDNGAPMLETNERGQFRDFLMNQEKQLRSYGWVDEKTGVARIPIERAMEFDRPARIARVSARQCGRKDERQRWPARHRRHQPERKSSVQ